MLSRFSITLRGAIGVRLLEEMVASLRGFMAMGMEPHLAFGLGGNTHRPRFSQPQSVVTERGCAKQCPSLGMALGVLRGEAAIAGSEGKRDFSHYILRNILGWLNSDRDNWSGEFRRQPNLI